MGEGIKTSRRRGASLENALLEAAWAELGESGFGDFTMESVAERAGTSRAVLYRRWPDRWDLAIAALKHYGDQNQVVPPDTGSFREDMIAYLGEASRRRSEMATVFAMGMAEYFRTRQTSPAELRNRMLKDRTVGGDVIFDRAVARGEIDPARLTPRVRRLAFDLLRTELMMTLRPASDDVILEIVDEIVIPLIGARPPGESPSSPNRTRNRGVAAGVDLGEPRSEDTPS